MRWFLLTLLSWLAGLAVYLMLLRGLYGGMISRGDFAAVLLWSGLAAGAALALLYAPGLVLLKTVLGGYRPVHVFATAGALLGVIPTWLIVWAFGGTVRSLLSHEAFLFSCLFSTVGLVFGYGFVKVQEGTGPHDDDAL